jgi:hypothetical protein
MGNPSINKRLKERQRQEKQRQKAAKREQRKSEKVDRPSSAGDVDPDIAHIIPGPQPILEEEGG